MVPVTTLEVAEMTKLYENCQRMVSIAYANEMADACLSHGIDPLEVCKAAATKPFGYQPYSPSLGVGGHCIPVNPFYLLSNSSWPFLELATKKMRSRPANMGDRIMAELVRDLPGRRPKVLVVGVSFKKGQSVLSNAPGIDLIVHLLSTYDVYVEFADPLVQDTELPYVHKLQHSTDWNVDSIDSSFDAVVVAMAQVGLDLDVLQRLQSAKVFNFTSALPWACPPMLAGVDSQRYTSRMSSVSSNDSTWSLGLRPPTPTECVSPELDKYIVLDMQDNIEHTVDMLEKASMTVIVTGTELNGSYELDGLLTGKA